MRNLLIGGAFAVAMFCACASTLNQVDPVVPSTDVTCFGPDGGPTGTTCPQGSMCGGDPAAVGCPAGKCCDVEPLVPLDSKRYVADGGRP
jgi:hypothetical protein